MNSILEHDKRTLDRVLLKEKVIRHASKAFAQKGIRQVKMDEMAAELAISKRTFYELIEDKESLLLEVMRFNHSEKLQMLEDVRQNANNVMEIIVAFYQYSIMQLERINIKFFEDLERYPRVLEKIKESRQQNSQKMIQFFQLGIDQGIFVEDLKPEILEFLFDEQMERVLHSDLLRHYAISQIFENTMMIMLRGISSAKGLEIIDKYLQEQAS